MTAVVAIFLIVLIVLGFLFVGEKDPIYSQICWCLGNLLGAMVGAYYATKKMED